MTHHRVSSEISWLFWDGFLAMPLRAYHRGLGHSAEKPEPLAAGREGCGQRVAWSGVGRVFRQNKCLGLPVSEFRGAQDV